MPPTIIQDSHLYITCRVLARAQLHKFEHTSHLAITLSYEIQYNTNALVSVYFHSFSCIFIMPFNLETWVVVILGNVLKFLLNDILLTFFFCSFIVELNFSDIGSSLTAVDHPLLFTPVFHP